MAPSRAAFRIVAAVLLLTSCEDGLGGPGETAPDPASVLFIDGDVVTMADGGTATALAVRNDSIVFVGSTSAALEYQGEATAVVDLGGRALVPGFVDAHSHMFNNASIQDLNIAQAQDTMLSYGITTVGNLWVDPGFLEEIQAFDAAGDLKIRTSLYLGRASNCGNSLGDWYTAYPPTRAWGETLRIGGLKIYADGGSCGAPANTEEPWPGWGLGDLWFTAAELEALVREGDAAGYQVVIHSRGDRALETTLDALEAALDGGANPNRHRMDHNDFLRDDLIGRYGQIGIQPVLRVRFYACVLEEDESEFVRTTYARTGDIVAANPDVSPAWHSDSPWVGPLNPMLALYELVTRNQVAADGSRCTAPSWSAVQAVSRPTGLRMMTTNAAYALIRDTEVGSLEVGKLADLVILSGNPLTDAAESLPDIGVLMTMIGGSVVYCRADAGALCPGI